MKRVLLALLTALPLAAGVAVAQAASPGFPGGSGLSSGSGFPGGFGFPGGAGATTTTDQAAVTGTVVSVDPSAGTFVANAYVLTPPSMGTGGSNGWPGSTGGSTGGVGGSTGGFGSFSGGGAGGRGGLSKTHATHSEAPAVTQVTITANSSTTIRVDGSKGAASLSDLVAGSKFLALFPGSSSDTIQTLVASPATAISVQVPKQIYAFVGTVSATSTTADTVTVDVMRSMPSGLIADGSSATFTVSRQTFIIGGSSLTGGSGGGLFGGLFGGSLSNVSTGDMVAGGLIGNTALTATQVESSPLMFLLDLPAPTATTTSATTRKASSKALTETVRVLHGGKVKLRKHGKKSHHKSKSNSGR